MMVKTIILTATTMTKVTLLSLLQRIDHSHYHVLALTKIVISLETMPTLTPAVLTTRMATRVGHFDDYER